MLIFDRESTRGKRFFLDESGIDKCSKCFSRAHLHLDLKNQAALFEIVSKALIAHGLKDNFTNEIQEKIIKNFFRYANDSLLGIFLESINHKKIQLSPGILFYQLVGIFGYKESKMILSRLNPGALNLIRNDPVVRISEWVKVFPQTRLKDFF